MRNKIIIACFFVGLITGCVQKSYKRTVVFLLDAKDVKDVHSVGIRGIDKPLSWDYDLKMDAVKKDSSYKATVSFYTGYKFTEIKFVINDQFELKDQANRRVEFSEKDTTFFKATYNHSK